jgi:hypothetical protein
MTDFGDSEPEDSWDADDPVPEQLHNIVRRIVLLRFTLGPLATQREQLRLQHIEDDLQFIKERIEHGG